MAGHPRGADKLIERMGTMTAFHAHLLGARYVVRNERRGGVRKIAGRAFVCGWTASHPTTYQPAGIYEGLTTRGCFGTTDPIHKHWESL